MIARSSLACCLLVACGGGAPAGVDARPIDAPPDTLGTSTGDPPPGAIALAVTALGVVAPDVPVYFQNADSSIVLATKTDAKGVAWANLADGGYVTAIEPPNATGATPLTTFAAVKAGDRLRLALQPTMPVQLVNVTLTVPDAAVPGGMGYQIYNSCGDKVAIAGTTGPVVLADCGQGVIDLLVVAVDGQGNETVGLVATAVPIVDGGSATVTGTYASFAAQPFTYRNIPSQLAWLGTYRAIVTPRGRLYANSTGDQVAATSLTDSVALPPVASDALVLTVTDEMPVASELGEQTLFDWRAISPAYDLDLAGSRIPPLTSVPAYNVATHAIMWGERSGGMAANFVRLTLHADRADIPSDHSWSWRIAAPKSAPMVVLPTLPVDGFDFNPAAGDITTIDGFTTAALPDGYDAIRVHAFDDLTQTNRTTPGTMVIQTQFAGPSL